MPVTATDRPILRNVQMNKSATIQNVLLGVGAVVMIAALVFLYNKTQAVDLRVENEVIGLLRELKEIDGRWDVDVLRAALEPDSSALQPVDRRPAAERALRSLEEAASKKPQSALGASLPELAKAIREKGNLIEEFRKVNLEAKAGLSGLVGHATELGAAAPSPSTPSKSPNPSSTISTRPGRSR